MMKEIKGYEDKYGVCDDGTIINLNTGKKLKSRANIKSGYYQVTLWKNCAYKVYYVHRLVAEAFISNNMNKPYVTHLDGDYANNSFTNLKWTDKIQKQVKDGKEEK